MVATATTTRQLRSFGLIVGGGFALVALAPMVLRHQSPRAWVLGLTVLLAVPARVFPNALKPLYRVWMALAEIRAWVNTRIILVLVYYGVLVPTGALPQIMGKDYLRLRVDRNTETYRVIRTKRPASHMQRQS